MKQTSLFLLFFPLLLWSCKDEEQCPAKDYVEATFQLTGEWAEDYPQFEEFMDYIGIEVLQTEHLMRMGCLMTLPTLKSNYAQTSSTSLELCLYQIEERKYPFH